MNRKEMRAQMMTKSKLLNALDELVNAENQNDFSMVTYRTSKKNATIIELMSIIFQKPVSALFTTMLSEKIVESLFEDASNIELLNEYFGLEHSDSGFIKLLEEQGVIKKHYSLSDLGLDDVVSKLDKLNGN